MKDGSYIDMGNTGLMLNIITPLQKGRGGTTISDALKQRYQDLFQYDMSTEEAKKIEELYTKDKKVMNLGFKDKRQ